jgi:hypothetical protein
VIRRNGNVRGAAADYTQDRREHASHRGNLATLPIPRGRQCVVVSEQLVCAIDQMDFHARLQLNITGSAPLHQPERDGFARVASG